MFDTADMKPAARRMRTDRRSIRAVLADGERLTGRELADRLGVTTRAVQLVVCNAVKAHTPWLAREMEYGEYVYFLTAGATPPRPMTGVLVLAVFDGFDVPLGMFNCRVAAMRFAESVTAADACKALDIAWNGQAGSTELSGIVIAPISGTTPQAIEIVKEFA